MSLYALIGNYLEPLAYLVYLIAILLYAKQHAQEGMKTLLLYYSIASALMLSCAIMVALKTGETIWLYNLNAFATVWLLGLYFRNLFYSRLKKITVTVLIAVGTIYLLVKNMVLQEFHLFDSVGYSIVSFSVVLYVIMYFHQLLSNVTDENLFHDFNFWLGSGYLIYFLGSFIIFLTYHYFTNRILATYTQEERQLLTNLWGLHNCLLFSGAGLLLGFILWLGYQRKSALS